MFSQSVQLEVPLLMIAKSKTGQIDENEERQHQSEDEDLVRVLPLAGVFHPEGPGDEIKEEPGDIRRERKPAVNRREKHRGRAHEDQPDGNPRKNRESEEEESSDEKQDATNRFHGEFSFQAEGSKKPRFSARQTASKSKRGGFCGLFRVFAIKEVAEHIENARNATIDQARPIAPNEPLLRNGRGDRPDQVQHEENENQDRQHLDPAPMMAIEGVDHAGNAATEINR
jgi:hypothetical protein